VLRAVASEVPGSAHPLPLAGLLPSPSNSRLQAVRGYRLVPSDPLGLLLERYVRADPNRALGGMRALSGFDYQLRVYLAKACEALARNDIEAVPLPEAFSDIFERQVFIQVKHRLDRGRDRLRDAAREFLAIDAFLQQEAAELAALVQYQVHCSIDERREDDPWGSFTFAPSERDREAKEARVRELHTEGRLLPPLEEPDPWWRAVVACFSKLDDTFAFLSAAMDALLRLLSSLKPEEARNRVVELWEQHRLQDQLETCALAPRDFAPTEQTSQILIGRRPGLRYLREGAFVPRPKMVKLALEALREAFPEGRSVDSIPLFWVTGASGSGKSWLLLEIMEALVCEQQARVVWLDDRSSDLAPLLRRWADAPTQEDMGEWFVFVDDLYAPGQQRALDIPAVARLIGSHRLRYPIIITCGPPEQRDELSHEGASAFEIVYWSLPLADREEQQAFRKWFEDRTGRPPQQQGTAFAEEAGLPISMVFEMAEGTLTEFAERFRRRLEPTGLIEPLTCPLALNRLYLWPPLHWLSDAQQAELRRVSWEGDFTYEPETRGDRLRITHPHLADGIYQGLYRPDETTRAIHLSEAFARAATEANPITISLLHLLHQGHPRLDTVDGEALLSRLSPIWDLARDTRLDSYGRTEVAIYAAALAARSPHLRATARVGLDPLAAAREALEAPHPRWGWLWQQLVVAYPEDAPLVEQGLGWLEPSLRGYAPDWTFVWRCLADVAGKDPRLPDAGRRWLILHAWQSGWAYVFRIMIERWPELAPLDRALDLLKTLPDNRSWGYVWTALAGSSQPLPEPADLPAAGWEWLEGRQDRPDWAFVWQGLADILPREDERRPHLIEQGQQWLQGREQRDDWGHVYEYCLEAGVSDPQFLEAGLDWIQQHVEETYALFILDKLLGALSNVTSETPAVVTTLDWLRSHWGHPSWGFLWRALFERGLRGEVEEAGFEFCQRYPDDPRATYVEEPLAESVDGSNARRVAALAVAYPRASCSGACVLSAYRAAGGEASVTAACREWLLAHPTRIPRGWIQLFCRLGPEDHTPETLALGIGLVGRYVIQSSPDILLYLVWLWDQLDPAQQGTVLQSAHQSLAAQARPLLRGWQSVAELLAAWGQEVPGFSPSPASPESLLVTYRRAPDKVGAAEACRHWLLAYPRIKPPGWKRFFCALRPEHHTPETTALGVGLVAYVPLQNTPAMLLYLSQFQEQLTPEQGEVLLDSVRQSLAAQARPLNKEWQPLADLIVGWGHEVPEFRPPQAVARDLITAYRRDPDEAGAVEVCRQFLVAHSGTNKPRGWATLFCALRPEHHTPETTASGVALVTYVPMQSTPAMLLYLSQFQEQFTPEQEDVLLDSVRQSLAAQARPLNEEWQPLADLLVQWGQEVPEFRPPQAGARDLITAYRRYRDNAGVAEVCRQFLVAHPGAKKPRGWGTLFCLLSPEHQTEATIESAVEAIRHFPVQNHPVLLAGTARLQDRLTPEQKDFLLDSVRQSLAAQARPLNEEWQPLADLLVEWSQEVPEFRPPQPAVGRLIGAYQRDPGDPAVVEACLQYLVAQLDEKPKGWAALFCALRPEHHTDETIQAVIGMLERTPLRDSTGTLTAVARLRHRLSPAQVRIYAASLRQSLAAQARPLSEGWQPLADLLVSWGQEVPPFAPAQATAGSLAAACRHDPQDAAVAEASREFLLAHPGEEKPSGWVPLFCALDPGYQTDATIRAAVAVIRYSPVQGRPWLLASIARLRDRLTAGQRDVLLDSMRQSLAAQARPLSEKWQPLEDLLVEWGQEVPDFSPPQPSDEPPVTACERGTEDATPVEASQQPSQTPPQEKPEEAAVTSCAAAPQSTNGRAEALIGVLRRVRVRNTPATLTAVAQLRERLTAEQRGVFLDSMRQSLAARAQPLSEEWQRLADLLVEWSQEVPEFRPPQPADATPTAAGQSDAEDTAEAEAPRPPAPAPAGGEPVGSGVHPNATPPQRTDAAERLVGILRRVPLRDTPATLTAVARLHHRLGPEQLEVLVTSLRRSLANPERQPSPQWDDLARLLAEINPLAPS